jgi:hypothetical protein
MELWRTRLARKVSRTREGEERGGEILLGERRKEGREEMGT